MPILAAKLPYTHPFAGGFPYRGSQRLPSDPDALTYLAAVAAADGAPVEVGVAVAVDDFFKGCKADGIWDAIKASCILCGARTLAGALVPLVGTAPTNVADGFVEGDYSRTAGLGDPGGTSYLDSGRASDDDPANDCHLAVYATSAPSVSIKMYVGGQVSNPYDIYRSSADMQFRNGGTQVASGAGGSTGLIASARNASDSFSIRIDGETTSAASVARTPNAANMFVFARNNNGTADFISDATIAFYSLGTSPGSDPETGLADLDTRVTTLITAIGNAL